MWGRIKKGMKFQLDAGRRSALLSSSQRVKPHFVAESLITSTVKDALSRTPRETLPATRVRIRPRDQPEPDLTTEEERRLIASLRQMHKSGSPLEPCTCKSHTCNWRQRSCSSRSILASMRCVRESTSSWTPLAGETSHRQRILGDTAAIDLFVLAGYAGNQLRFINIVHFASICGVVTLIPSKHPKIVWGHKTLDHSFWRAAKADLRPRMRIRARVRTRARRPGVRTHADSSHHSTGKRSL